VKEAEKRRLFFQAKKRKELKKVFPSATEVLKSLTTKKVELRVRFEEPDDLHDFLKYCVELVEFLNFGMEIEKDEVKLKYKGEDLNDIEKALKYLYSLKSFQLAENFCIFEDGKKKFASGKTGIPKVPYTSKSSFHFSKIFGEAEKDVIKKILLNYFSQDTIQILFKACKDRLLAYEKLEEVGKETHLRWRTCLIKKLYEKILVKEPMDLINLLKKDTFSFYPAVFQEFEFEGKKLKLQSRIVVELDPSPGNEKYASEICNLIYKNFLNQGRLMFSGSKSGRVEFELDVISLLKHSEDLVKEFPWLGYFSVKSLEDFDLKDFYKLVLKGFEHSLYFQVLDKLEDLGYGFKKIILRKNSPFRHFSILLDFPKTVSIAMSSPKLIAREQRIPKKLLKYEKFRKWCNSYPFHLLVCVPVEKIPFSKEDVLKESHIVFASEKFLKDYEKFLKSYPSLFERSLVKIFLEKIDERRLENYLLNPYKFEKELVLKSSI